MTINDILLFLDSNGTHYTFNGDGNLEITGYSTTKDAKEHEMTWVKQGKALLNEKTNYLVFAKNGHVEPSRNMNDYNWIFVDDPKTSFFATLEHFFPPKKKEFVSNRSTVLTKNIGKNVVIGDNCYIDDEVVIGDDVVIYPNVVIMNKVTVGNRVVIQSFCCIGEDGFGYYENDKGEKIMISHYGGVVIGDDVFIGMHTDISRGTLGNTTIGNGTKIDDKVHIAHNCEIGKNVTIVESRLYGSVVVGDDAYIAGSTIRNQTRIGDNAIVGMGSVIRNDVDDYSVVIGNPPQVIRKGRKKS